MFCRPINITFVNMSCCNIPGERGSQTLSFGAAYWPALVQTVAYFSS